MNKLMTLCTAVAAAIFAAPGYAAPVEADPEARAEALILLPLTLSRIDDLSFGTVIPSTTSLGTVTIPANGNPRTAAGAGVTLVASDPGLRARFAGAGSAGQNVFINVTSPGTLSNGTDTVTVISLVMDRPALIQIDATRAFTFYVGGTIQLAPNQPEGLYSAEFDVTAQYL